MKAVMAMYEGAQTVVKTTGDSKAFSVKVGLHQWYGILGFNVPLDTV